MTQFRYQMAFQYACAWSGVACVLLFFLAFFIMGFVPPLSPSMSATEVAAHYRDHQTAVQVGGVVMLVSSMFYASYTAVMSGQMRRIQGVHRTVVYTQLAAGAFASLTFLIPAMLFEVVAYAPERDVELTEMLNQFAWIFLVMPWSPFLVQNWAFAFAILSDRAARPLLPRWLAYLNLWAPIVFAPSVLLPFFRSGPFAWSGLFVIWIPAIVFILQFVANASCVHRAVRQEAQAQQRPATADEPAADEPRAARSTPTTSVPA